MQCNLVYAVSMRIVFFTGLPAKMETEIPGLSRIFQDSYHENSRIFQDFKLSNSKLLRWENIKISQKKHTLYITTRQMS